MPMINAHLAENVLFTPIEEGADTLNIVTGYASPTMGSWYLTSLRERRNRMKFPIIHVNLIIGMTPIEGIRLSSHNGFQELYRASGSGDIPDTFACSYVFNFPAVRSNLYVWTKGDTPITSFTGSAPFLQSSFLPSHIEDLLEKTDPVDSFRYYQSIEQRSMFCVHAEIEQQVRITNDFPSGLQLQDQQIKTEEITVSLLTRTGAVGRHSGLNWGQREGRNPNEAYIPIPRNISSSGFFPNNGQQFTVQTDDHKSLILRLEQAGDKALTTPLSNSLLGEYFRGRLGLSNGQFVSMSDLERYGRHDVTFTKIDEEQFYMDFSRSVN